MTTLARVLAAWRLWRATRLIRRAREALHSDQPLRAQALLAASGAILAANRQALR